LEIEVLIADHSCQEAPMRGHTLRHLAVTGAIAFTAILTTIGVVVSLRHHRCGELELLPIDGDPKALVEVIIRKHGGEELLRKRLAGVIEFEVQYEDDRTKHV
jgi:hypothetical protein